MSRESAREFLREVGLASRIVEYEVSSETVALAAEAIGCEECRIAKTMAFMTDGTASLVVAAGDVKIDNRLFKDFFGCKAKMLMRDELVSMVGHEAGGVCPFGILPGCKVYLDESLKRFDYVYPAAGDGHSVIKMTLSELEKYSGALSWCAVTKPI